MRKKILTILTLAAVGSTCWLGCGRKHPAKFIVVTADGKTNYYNGVKEAMSNAPIGSTVYIPPGLHTN